VDLTKLRDELQRAMTRCAGVVRTGPSLDVARAAVSGLAARLAVGPPSGVSPATDQVTGPAPGAAVAAGELANLLTVASALLRAARAREESRGAHSRADFPDTDPRWRLRIVHGASGSGTPTTTP
jgi:L-aspartate oxidase